MDRPVSERTAIGALLLGASAIGLAPILVRLSETGSTATAFWRCALSLPLLWAWMRWEQPTGGQQIDRRIIWPGLFFAGDLAVWHVSIFWTTVANATLLANCAPIFVALIAWLWLRERPGWLFAVGLIVALCGATLVLEASFTFSGQRLRGDLLGAATAVFYAGYQLTVKRLRATVSTGAIMFWSSLVCAVALLAVTIAFGEKTWPATARGWIVLVALALISHVGGQGLIAWALAHLPAGFSSVTLLWQPVVAAMAAWLAFREPLTPLQAAGGAVVLVGIYLARFGSPNRATSRPSPPEKDSR